MTDVGYSWFIGKLTEDPRTTETITITYPNYLLLLAEMRDDIASLENIATALEAISRITASIQHGQEITPDYRADLLGSTWESDFIRILTRYNNFAQLWNSHKFEVHGYVPVHGLDQDAQGPETDVLMQKLSKLIAFIFELTQGLKEHGYHLPEFPNTQEALAEQEIVASLPSTKKDHTEEISDGTEQIQQRTEEALKKVLDLETQNSSKPNLYPLNSTGTRFENQSIDQAWVQAHGSDMVKAVKDASDWSLENFMLTLIAGKEPSLQQYRFSSYAESRLLSAALCSVMDSVDTEIVRVSIAYLAD
ncbi:MAG: hypothetical protein ACFNNC_02595 [Rothia dentocariosa]